MASGPAGEGICYVTSKPKDPTTLPDANFNAFYDNEHIPDMLRYGFTKLGLRYKNANPDAQAAYLALYPQEDAANITSDATRKMMEEIKYSKVLDGQEHHAIIQYGVSAWTKIQVFEGEGHADKTGQDRGQTLVAVSVEPGEGEGAEDDLDAWYRKEHLEMLSKCPGYRRTTRYRRFLGDLPTYLALHEYACSAAELPAEQIAQTRETEWAKRVLAKAKAFERDVWELIGVQGEKGMKL